MEDKVPGVCVYEVEYTHSTQFTDKQYATWMDATLTCGLISFSLYSPSRYLFLRTCKSRVCVALLNVTTWCFVSHSAM